MIHKDSLIGAGLLVLALLVLWHVSSFPPAPGQPYNAALFPGLVAGGLAFAAILLIISGFRQQRDGRAAPAGTQSGAAPDPDDLPESSNMEVLETSKSPSRLLAVLLTVASVGFYLLVAKTLGFIITGIVLLVALMWAYGAPRKLILPVAIVATLLIHAAFYKLLSVPLPWGLLQPIAW